VKKDNKGDKYFRAKGWYLDFDSKTFSEAITVAGIWTF
jgi:hypothetical protein